MKNLIRLSSLVILLGVFAACRRENPADSSTTQDQVTPAPPETPAPAPAPVQRADTPSRPRSTARSPEPAPVTSDSARRPGSASVSDARPDRVESADRTPRAPSVEMLTVAAGTSLTVTMSDGVSSSENKEGDKFHAALTEAVIVDGRVVADKGDEVVGRIEDIVLPGKVKGRAQMTLVLSELSTSGRTYKIKTEPFMAIAVDNKERDAAIIAGGAGVGAAIGAITGGKKGAAIGAILGGGGGTAAVLATPGQSMKIEPETKVNFVLDNDVRLPVIRNRRD